MHYLNLLPGHVVDPDPSIYDRENYLVVDFETTNINKGDPVNPDNHIVMAMWWYKGKLKWKAADEFHLEELAKDIEEAEVVVAHNAKFECGWLRRIGLDLTKLVVFCTQIADYVILSNRRENYLRNLSLDKCCSRRGLSTKDSLVSRMIKGGICPSEIPVRWLADYGVQDVVLCRELFLRQRKELKETGQHKVFYTRNLMVPCLADIEATGMCVDSERVEAVYKRKLEEFERVSAELDKILGGRNPRSAPQMAEFLYEELGFSELKDSKGNPLRTDKGAPKTDATTIEQLSPRNRKQKNFLAKKLQYSKLNAELTKALTKLKNLVDGDRTLLYASFNLCSTNTMRLSSSGKVPYNIQIQNIDRNHKPLFRARNPEWSIGEADEAQLEFRSAGELSKDERIIEDILNGVDVHSYTASVISDAGQPTERQAAKAHTFKPLYGGESGTEAERAYYSEFKRKYKTHTEEQERWVGIALDSGKLTLPTGHIFYYGKDSKSPVRITRTGYIENNQKVKNYPVQYLATAEIVPIGLVYAWHLLKAVGTQTFIICTIHDSIISEVHPDELDAYKEVMNYSLSVAPEEYFRKLYKIELTVPLEADIKIGTHWNESEQWREEWLLN